MKNYIFVDPFWTDAFSYWFMGHEVIFRFSFQVIYNVDGFIDKNNDLLFKDMSKAMFGCEHLFLKEMFPEGMNLYFSPLPVVTTSSKFYCASQTKLSMKNKSTLIHSTEITYELPLQF